MHWPLVPNLFSLSLLTFSCVSLGFTAVQVCVLFTVCSPIRAIAWSAALHATLSRIDRPVWLLIPNNSSSSIKRMVRERQHKRGTRGGIERVDRKQKNAQRLSLGSSWYSPYDQQKQQIQAAKYLNGLPQYSAINMIRVYGCEWAWSLVLSLSPCSSTALEVLIESLWHTWTH